MKRAQLTNGLTVIYLQTPQDPILAGHLFLPTGASYEPENKWGISSLLWSLFSKGTKNKSARQFAEEIESIGAFVGAGSTLDYAEASFHATSDQFEIAMGFLREALLEPAFLEDQMEKERVALLAHLKAKDESPFTVTHERLAAELFPGDPYGRPSGGREDSVTSLTRADLNAWHQRVVNPVGAVFSLASDLSFEKVLPAIERMFGEKSWPKANGLPNAKLPLIRELKETKSISSSAAYEQACLMIGVRATNAMGPDYAAIKVLNNILGGGMSTRLFQSLREKEGLAYDVGSFYPTRRRESLFVVQMGLQPDRLEQAKKGIWRELQRLQDELIPEEELKRTVRQIRGSFVLDHQTNSQRAHYKGWWEILGLGLDFDLAYLKRAEAVTSTDVQAVARKLFSQPSITVETVPNKVKAPRKVPA